MSSKKLSTDSRYKLNAVCPYYTMFPLEFPMKLLKRRSRDCVVLDVFCGRGTTNFAAQVNGLVSYGLDTSPVAVAIARAKLCAARSDQVLSLLKSALDKIDLDDVPTGEFWKLAFHPETLVQVCGVRRALLDGKETAASVILRAIMLGCS